ncbi:class I SAM-dependent methyltransferase [Agrobacterium sp. SORGH_AS 787]|uniref:class I SAM-dependent methyltransferase n=1 Tax=Agrobacterium sp. SORGH_AS 787 TaxID=3041775 RepID=UPI002783EA5F|nr:SAM-dependent methyltransferase [Rhizobium sp. SORGH_AS_0787]
MSDDAASNVIALYQAYAADFDRSRSRELMEKPWLDRFLAHLPPKASILDMGCGAGEPIARYCIERGHQLTGIDASISLILLCRERFPGHRWLVGDMRDLRLDRRFDGLIAWHSLFHLTPDDQQIVLERSMRRATENAVLLFTAGPDRQETFGRFCGQTLYHASLAFEEYRLILADGGFEIIAHEIEDQSCGGATIYLAKRSRS